MKIHLRTSGDMGKRWSNRTFCGMPSRPKGGILRFYRVTKYATLVTCERCLRKLYTIKGNK